MSITYRNYYLIPVARGEYVCGVEDHKQPGEHFFHEDFKAGKRKRYTAWAGGGGIGQFDTHEEAKAALLGHLKREAREKIDRMIGEIVRQQGILDALAARGLDAFETEQPAEKKRA